MESAEMTGSADLRRLLLCGFAALGAFALSCQVLPSSYDASTYEDPYGRSGLPPVSANSPEGAALADTLGQIEGVGIDGDEVEGPAGREATIERLIEELGERHTGLSQREIHAVARTIVDECAAQDLEVGIVMAVIQVESAGYHRAVSPVGARGLMQLMPGTGEEMARKRGLAWHGPGTLFDPVINVKLGIAYLRQLSDRYDHVPTALAAYNWGPGRIDRRIRRGVKMPKLYVEQVMRAYGSADDKLDDSAS
jgi:hypothetical protein